MWVLDFDEAAAIGAGRTEWNAEGYFGNEASDISFYVKAALIMDIPEYSETRGDRVEPKKKAKKAERQPAKAWWRCRRCWRLEHYEWCECVSDDEIGMIFD